MDQYYLRTDARGGITHSASPKMIPGGLTNLLEFSGHLTKELTIGTIDQVKRGMTSATVQRLAGSTSGEAEEPKSYFAMIDHQDRPSLDKALDTFCVSSEQEKTFWREYQSTLRDALDPQIHIDVGFGVPAANREFFQHNLQYAAKLLGKQVREGTPLLPTNPPGRCKFCKRGNYWTICYRGDERPVTDAVGIPAALLASSRPLA